MICQVFIHIEVMQKEGSTSVVTYDKSVYQVDVSVVSGFAEGSLQSEVIAFKTDSEDKSAVCEFVNTKTTPSRTPEKPTETDKPDEPETPTDSTTPSNGTPNRSGSSGSSGSSGGASVSQDGKGGSSSGGLSRQAGGYQTGDMPIIGILILSGVAIIVLVVAIIWKRKRNS